MVKLFINSVVLYSLVEGSAFRTFTHFNDEAQLKLQGSYSQNDLPGCDTYHLNQCQGNVIETDPSFESYRWYTPAKGEKGYLPSFQDYSHLVGYANMQYTDGNHNSATVEIRATHKDNVSLTYVFNGVEQTDKVKTFSSDFTETLNVVIKGSDGRQIKLEPIDFWWNTHGGFKERKGDYRNGQKGAIIEMFGWPDKDIEQECQFIADAGYLGVKLFPHQESLMASQPFNNIMNPWYFFYQPVSYSLNGRMGSRDDLRTLIKTCRSMGVRVYADAVINHMTGGGNDMGEHRNNAGSCVTWGNKSSTNVDGPSPFYSQNFAYKTSPNTGKPMSQEYPAAALGPLDFHCERVLNAWNDPLMLNAGWLTGLTDLNTEREHVQERIAAYLTDLLSIGLSGFRIDAAKHIKPDDLVLIFEKLKRNMGGTLPEDFITWWEVILGGEADLLMCNSGSGYNFGGYLENKLREHAFSQADMDKIKIWNSGYPKETEKGLVNCDGNSPKIRQAIQNDDADQQNPGSSSRDMGNDGCVLIKGCDDNSHRNYEIKLFESPKGARDNKNDFPIRLILSSYYWENGIQGIPDGLSDCSLCTVDCNTCRGVKYQKAHDSNSKGYDKAGYTRVHRDQGIINAMRKWMEI